MRRQKITSVPASKELEGITTRTELLPESEDTAASTDSLPTMFQVNTLAMSELLVPAKDDWRHCAVKFTFAAATVYVAAGWYVFVPSLQPMNLKFERVGAAATEKVCPAVYVPPDGIPETVSKVPVE